MDLVDEDWEIRLEARPEDDLNESAAVCRGNP